MTKNLIIFALSVLILIGSIWGSIADKSSMVLKDRLREKNIELEEFKNRLTKEHDKVLGKSANLQETLDGKDVQIKQEREIIVDLRKEKLSLQSKIAGQEATTNKLHNDLKTLTVQLASARAELKKRERVALSTGGSGGSGDCSAQLQKAASKLSRLTIEQYRNKQLIASLQKGGSATTPDTAQSSSIIKLNKALDNTRADLLTAKKERNESQLRLTALQSETQRARENNMRELDSARAQIFGLEKILDQKNQGLKNLTRELDRSKINMDILLTKITEQQDQLLRMENEKKRIFNEISAKNDEISSLNQKLMGTPVN